MFAIKDAAASGSSLTTCKFGNQTVTSLFLHFCKIQCPALVYENTEVVIVQTDAKTFADMFQYPICNLCVVNLLYFTICQRLTKFMTSTSLSAQKWLTGICEPLLNFSVTNSVTNSCPKGKLFAGNCM